MKEKEIATVRFCKIMFNLSAINAQNKLQHGSVVDSLKMKPRYITIQTVQNNHHVYTNRRGK
jgi:hypothetical protein